MPAGAGVSGVRAAAFIPARGNSGTKARGLQHDRFFGPIQEAFSHRDGGKAVGDGSAPRPEVGGAVKDFRGFGHLPLFFPGAFC